MTKVVLLSRSSLAGAPYWMWHCLRKYSTDLEVRYICHQPSYADGRSFKYDILRSHPTAEQVIREADVVHIMNYLIPKDKEILEPHRQKIIGHFHSVPYNPVFKPLECFAHIKVVVNQPAQRLVYPHYVPLYTPLDIWEWTPDETKPTFPIKIIFCPTNRRADTRLDSKGYHTIIPIMKQFLRLHANVQFIHYGNKKHFEHLQCKRACHICIDDIVHTHNTHHLTSLEGALFGQAVLTSTKPEAGYPFIQCITNNLKNKLEYLCSNISHIQEAGVKAREWMEKNYRPEDIVKEYIQLYNK